MTNTLKIGAYYIVTHRRKGKFIGIIEGVDGEWIEVKITEGVAQAMVPENIGIVGDTIRIRASLAKLEKIQEA